MGTDRTQLLACLDCGLGIILISYNFNKQLLVNVVSKLIDDGIQRYEYHYLKPIIRANKEAVHKAAPRSPSPLFFEVLD